MSVLVVLFGCALAFPSDGDLMRFPGPMTISKNPTDAVAGIPGSSNEFPENVAFGLPCEDMNDEPTTTPVPDPTPTPQLYPEVDDISWKILKTIKSILQYSGCNITSQYSLPLATEIWKRLPHVKHETNSCPEFLRKNPTFPDTPTPSPAPVPLSHEDRKLLDAIRKSGEMNEDSKKKLVTEIHTAAYDRATEKAELANSESQMAPLPIVPEDCGDDYTGSVGLRNDEVSASGSAMNKGFHPIPPVYDSRGHREPLEVREHIVGARSASHELLALLQEQGVSSECTIYRGMKISNAQPMDATHTDLYGECERACLFDDDCIGWIFETPTLGSSKNLDNCRLFNSSVAPMLVDATPNLVSGLCPKSKICSQSVMQKIIAATHSVEAQTAGCPRILELLIAGQSLPKRETCLCINNIKANNPEQMVATECLMGPDALPWNSVVKMCDTVDIPHLLQRAPSCLGTVSFSSGQGGCPTYDIASELSNHVHCSTDYDKQQHVFAYQACPECGRCLATPTPTPFVPPPELAAGFALPNGQKTPCLAAKQSAVEELGTGPLMGYFAPDCFRDGSYMPTQCIDQECWCVYENGVEIDGTRHPKSQKGLPCRPAPPMAPVYPSFPAPIVSIEQQIVRAIGKLVYADVLPEAFCRIGLNLTIEGHVLEATHFHRVRNPHSPTCPIRPPLLPVTLENVLTHLAHILVPDPIRRFSPSSSPSPSPSLTPSVSISPSPSPSAPIPMCGDVQCKDLGLNVHMYQQVPPGWCHLCLEGTSGPCRDSATFACHDYMIGNKCRYNHFQCSDSPSDVHPNTRPDCADRQGDHMEFTGQVLLSTPHHEDFVKIWGVVVSSAFADVTGIRNLCDISIEKAEDFNGRLLLSFSIARKELEQVNKDADSIREAVNNGSLLSSLRRRGLPVIGDETVLVSGHVKEIVGMM